MANTKRAGSDWIDWLKDAIATQSDGHCSTSIMYIDPLVDIVVSGSSIRIDVVRRFDARSGGDLTLFPDRRTILYSGTRSTAGADLMIIRNFR